MVSFSKFDSFVESTTEKAHDLGADALKIALSNTLPIAGNSILTDITQISAGNGYVAGGQAITVTSSAQTGGLYKLVADDEVFTASGGAIATFQYVILYNDTATSDELIGFYTAASAINLADGETFTVDFNQANGILTLQ